MVTAPRGRAGRVRRRTGAEPPRLYSDSREEELFFLGLRSERLASAYWSTSAATLRTATGIFTAQPTPNTRSVKIWSDSGFQYASRRRSNVGKRKSYGTTPATFPCQVRSASGFLSS